MHASQRLRDADGSTERAKQQVGGLANEIEGVSDRFQELERDINRTRRAHEEWQREQGNQPGGGGPTPQARMDQSWWQRDAWWKLDPLGDWMRRQETGATGTMKLQSDIAAGEMMRGGFTETIARTRADLEAGLITADQAQTTIAEFGQRLQTVNQELEGLRGRLAVASGAAPPIPSMGPRMGPPVGAASPASRGGIARNDAQNAVLLEWGQARAELERATGDQINETVRQYNEQRADTIEQYEQTIAREARDFATQRLRAEQDHASAIAEVREQTAARELQMAEDLARTIAGARSDSSDRLADMQEDLDRTLGQRRADSAERVAEWEADRDEAIEERRKDSADRILELEEDFARDRVRAQAQFQLSLEEAAARGDGRAVYRLQQRHELEQEEAARAHTERVSDEKTKLQEAIDQLNEAHEERVGDEKKALDKAIGQAQDAYDRQVEDQKKALDQRIKDANLAYQEQLADAKEADAQRILDMETDFAERKLREDADRTTRLGDLATDHNNQLDEQDRVHGERIQQIKDHAQEERDELDAQATTDLLALGVRHAGWLGEQTRKEAELEKLWDEFMGHINGTLTNPMPVPGPGQNEALTPRRQQLEAERKYLLESQRAFPPGLGEWGSLQTKIDAIETELKSLGWTPPTTPSTAMVSASALMANSRFTMPAPMPSVAASASGGGAGGFTIGSLSVAVYGAPTDSPRDFADKFRHELLTTLRDVKGQM